MSLALSADVTAEVGLTKDLVIDGDERADSLMGQLLEHMGAAARDADDCHDRLRQLEVALGSDGNRLTIEPGVGRHGP